MLDENIEEHLILKLVYYLKINYKEYIILEEYMCEEGVYVLINNDENKKIIGIVPTKSESIYESDIFVIKDFTNDIKHFIHKHFNPEKEIPKDKPHIYCDEQGGIIVYNYNLLESSGFYNKIIPKEERTKENLLNNYYIIYQSFYDCAKDACEGDYSVLTNEEAVINFLVEL